MDLLEAIKCRHSVRSYISQPISGYVKDSLSDIIRQCNEESGLHIQLCLNEPTAFSGRMAHYGSFRNVRNYIALIGKKTQDLQEKCGYYGEKIVLKAQQLGLNTCWVALTYSKGKTACIIEKDEKLCCVIAIGYGETQGMSHKTKPINELYQGQEPVPEWFKNGVAAAQLAPTAVNQQKFLFILKGDTVSAKTLNGFYTKLDLGIVKYHFEIGAGSEGWTWARQTD